MSDLSQQAHSKIVAIEAIVGSLKSKRGVVNSFKVKDYEDAAAAQWSGQKRESFLDTIEETKSAYSQVNEQIDQAISECKSMQRSLLANIDFAKHPILHADAVRLSW